MLSPAWTGSGESDLVTERSAAVEVSTLVVAVALLLSRFLSLVSLDTLAVLLITVPAGVSALTFTTRMNVAVAPLANASAAAVTLPGAVAPAASVARLAVTVPVSPAAGVVRVNAGPLSWVKDANVVFAGMASVIVTLRASLGPAFAAPMV